MTTKSWCPIQFLLERTSVLAAATFVPETWSSTAGHAWAQTGTELRRPGEPLELGQVYEANGVILAAQLVTAGAEVERLAAVADDEDAHRGALSRGLEFDLLVS